MQDYIAQDHLNNPDPGFPDYLVKEHALQQIERETAKLSSLRAPSIVGQITGTNDDGSFIVVMVGGATYGSVSSQSGTAWTVGTWVTVEYANGCYQIVGYGAYNAGGNTVLSEDPAPGPSPNNGASNGYSS